MTPVKIAGVYYAFWTCVPGYCDKHPEATRHKGSLHTGDKREAAARCAELSTRLEAERARNTLGLSPKAQSSMLLSEFAKAYAESTEHDHSEVTRQDYNDNMKCLMKYVGDVKLKDLTQAVLENFKKRRLATIAPRSWNSQLGILKAVFGWGLSRQPPLYEKNPFDGVTRVDKGEPTVKKYAAADEIKAAALQGSDFDVNMLAFLYATWCRSGELRRLRWDDIHWDQGYLEFVRPKERRKRKNKRLPLTPDLIMILDKAKKLRPDSPLVFPNPKGGMLSKRQVYYYINKMGNKAAVKLSPHMLRHSGITDALTRGAKAHAVQLVAGHSSIQTTMNYNHTDLGEARIAMELLHRPLLTQPEAGQGNISGEVRDGDNIHTV